MSSVPSAAKAWSLESSYPVLTFLGFFFLRQGERIVFEMGSVVTGRVRLLESVIAYAVHSLF